MSLFFAISTACAPVNASNRLYPSGVRIYFQRIDDVRLVVANQNVVHVVFLPLVIFFSYYITGFFKMKEVYFLKWD